VDEAASTGRGKNFTSRLVWALSCCAGVALLVLGSNVSWASWLGVGFIVGVTWLALRELLLRKTADGEGLSWAVGVLAAFLVFGVAIFMGEAFGFAGLGALAVLIMDH